METENRFVQRISDTILLLNRGKKLSAKPQRLILRSLVSEYIKNQRDNKESIIWTKYSQTEKNMERRLLRKIGERIQ